MDTIKPPALPRGATLGIFTPSMPAHLLNPGMYNNSLSTLQAMGFQVVEGSVTAAQVGQGYRTAPPQDRAAELMELFTNPEVDGIVAMIGGSNSSSLIPYLDFDLIAAHPKVFCGYSDITSLHLAILAYSGLRTFYGPAIVPSFGEWPQPLEVTRDSFLQAVTDTQPTPRVLQPPDQWSNHFRDWATGQWKRVPREFQPNQGWRVLQSGKASAPLLLANLSTFVTAAGTDYFPDCRGKILLLESMDAAFSKEERNLRHLERLGLFDDLAGLIIGKPERPDRQGAPFTHDELILEVVGNARPYPILSQFDCSHTHPMLTIAQQTPISLEADAEFNATVRLEEPMVVAVA